MSTISVSNITDGTDTVGTSYVVNGSAKAWVNFNQQSTMSIFGSFNISSLTDAGTGLTDIALSSSMSNTGFALAITRQDTVVNNDSTGFDGINNKTVSNFRFVSIENAVVSDTNNGHGIVHGDLA